ncbi:SRPBCC family protein [Glaciecola sp. 2405UD65-10]|jgi:ribosome-associated toxin RatA of RatAB toxin-antitoxin module|uniref:SRPBCC family protein n=1 Tax=Glaciecola sp. 2405UD65-10 TaxID=3397244 RepID=UPI003B5C9CCD
MPTINKNALVPYSAEQMYNLVNDVDSYQEFLPGCRSSEVISESESQMHAKMTLAKAGIEQVLVTKNTLIPNEQIIMQLSEGPFKQLGGGWTFTPLSDEACKIELSLDFTFSSRLVDMAFGKVFKALTNNMVKAFSDRAKEVYK